MGRYTGKRCRLLTMFSLTATFFLVELIVGYATNSMALVADSFHMLSDIAALIIAFVSVKMAPMSWSKNTFGWARAEVLGALVNAVFLVALCFSISVESLKRFYNPEEINNSEMILVVGSIGLLVNLIGLCLFREHSHSHASSSGTALRATNANSLKGVNDELSVIDGKSRRISETVHNLTGHGALSHLTDLVDVVEDSSPCADEDGSGGENRCPDEMENAKSSIGNDETKCGSKADVSVIVDINGQSDMAPVMVHRKVPSASQQMNMRGIFLHVLADALGSVIVIVSALVMTFCTVDQCRPYTLYVDPGLSLLLVAIMMRGVWPLLIESALILLQTAPTHIDVDQLKRRLLVTVDGILAVHEFHVWQLTSDRIVASAHVRCLNLTQYMQLAERIKQFFHDEGIHSTTIQPEFVEYVPSSVCASLERQLADRLDVEDSKSSGAPRNSLAEPAAESDDCMINCPLPVEGSGQVSCDASRCCKPSRPPPSEQS